MKPSAPQILQALQNRKRPVPHRIVRCQSCRTHYRLPPPGYCGDCHHWNGAWQTLQANIQAMRGCANG